MKYFTFSLFVFQILWHIGIKSSIEKNDTHVSAALEIQITNENNTIIQKNEFENGNKHMIDMIFDNNHNDQDFFLHKRFE